MSEFRLISRDTATIWVGQLAVMAFGVADTLIAGRHSDAALAALSVGSALYISVYVALMGIVQALLPIWAEMLGAQRHEAVGRSLRQSLYLCTLIAATGITVLLFPGPLLRWAQVPELMQAEVQRYLTVLAFAFAPALWAAPGPRWSSTMCCWHWPWSCCARRLFTGPLPCGNLLSGQIGPSCATLPGWACQAGWPIWLR